MGTTTIRVYIKVIDENGKKRDRHFDIPQLPTSTTFEEFGEKARAEAESWCLGREFTLDNNDDTIKFRILPKGTQRIRISSL
ncbi:hypothetical protein ACFLZS_01475 [Patescibacteria group bacterium]